MTRIDPQTFAALRAAAAAEGATSAVAALDEVAGDQIVELLDMLVDWRKVIPGPLGAVVEAADGSFWREALDTIVHALDRDPKNVRKRARKARKRGDTDEAERLVALARRLEDERGIPHPADR